MGRVLRWTFPTTRLAFVPILIPRDHLTLDLERNGEGQTKRMYVCILCGEELMANPAAC
jgi:hypothetical protein